MGEYASAVYPLPVKRVMRKRVGIVPRQLLGEKVARSCRSGNLRKRAAVSERVRNPHFRRLDAKLFEEELLTLKELPCQRFATRQI